MSLNFFFFFNNTYNMNLVRILKTLSKIIRIDSVGIYLFMKLLFINYSFFFCYRPCRVILFS